jgi:transposase
VTDLLREIRPVLPSPFELRFETPPGQQAQVDFAQFQTEFTDEPGVIRIVWLFSLVLGHSRMMWCRFECAVRHGFQGRAPVQAPLY